MIIVDNEDKTLRFSHGEIKRANLVRCHKKRVKLPHTEDSVTIPSTLDQGVWNLYIYTDCGCFTSQIGIRCKEAEVRSTHTATRDLELPVLACCPFEEQEDLTKPAIFKNPPWLTVEVNTGVTQGDISPLPSRHYDFTTWRAYDANGVEMGCGSVTVKMSTLTLNPIKLKRTPTWVELT